MNNRLISAPSSVKSVMRPMVGRHALTGLLITAAILLGLGGARPANARTAGQATPPATAASAVAPANAAVPLAVDGTTAVTIGPDGKLWIYDLRGGRAGRTTTLAPADPEFKGFRQRAGVIAFKGATVAVGAPDEPNGGAVYIFTQNNNNWGEVIRIAAESGDQEFGRAVALSTDTLAIGVTDAEKRGAVQLYGVDKNSWTAISRLTVIDPDPGPQEQFGVSIAIEGDYLLIGTDRGAERPGAAYVFLRTAKSWSQQARLTADESSSGDRFGALVALSGKTAVISAPGAPGRSGVAYIFSRGDTTWGQRQTIFPTSGQEQFATAVAIYEPMIVIGLKGAALVYDRQGSTTWSLQATLRPPTPNDGFGQTVAATKDMAVAATLPTAASLAATPGPDAQLIVFSRQANNKWGAPQVALVR